VSYDLDARAELNEARHARALKALSPSDVLATEDNLVAQMLDARHHPSYELVAHCPRYGGVKRRGKRPYRSEMMGGPYEPLSDEAITRFVGGTWQIAWCGRMYHGGEHGLSRAVTIVAA
jgi:hypothetical protein